MNFIVKLSDGNRFVISSEEAKAIAQAEKGDTITLKNKGIIIERSFVSSVYPESQADEIEERKNQQTGILHDGTRVRKHFGRWVVDREKYNINGYEIDLEYPSPKDYPEIAKDYVLSCEQWEKKQKLLKNIDDKNMLK